MIVKLLCVCVVCVLSSLSGWAQVKASIRKEIRNYHIQNEDLDKQFSFPSFFLRDNNMSIIHKGNVVLKIAYDSTEMRDTLYYECNDIWINTHPGIIEICSLKKNKLNGYKVRLLASGGWSYISMKNGKRYGKHVAFNKEGYVTMIRLFKNDQQLWSHEIGLKFR